LSWLLAAALALSTDRPPPSLPAPWRLVDVPALHVGLRPALTLDNEDRGRLEGGAGVTLQLTGFVF